MASENAHDKWQASQPRVVSVSNKIDNVWSTHFTINNITDLDASIQNV